MKITNDQHLRLKNAVKALDQERLPWWTHWRDLADYYLPRRYIYLMSPQERVRNQTRNNRILDATGTMAARTLASGMMNGITSPSRPWFKLRIAGFQDDEGTASRVWLDEVTRRMMFAMAETNFYNSMAVVYLDLVVFGTAAMLIYEDFESVFRCYNVPLGEFYLAQGYRQQVHTFSRRCTYKVHQVVERWGLDNVTDQTKINWGQGENINRQQDVTVCHLIEPNVDDMGVSRNFAMREFYWEENATDGLVLGKAGYHEIPGIFPRWELMANDSYGSSPAMDALGDVIQLQHQTKKKAQGLDKLIDPPMVADIQLQHQPTALLPGGITYVAGVNNVGMKPAYTIQLPLDMMTQDMREVQGRIGEIFHNDLFRMISQLDTVRSATEIDARREEKLVLLGPVLERFENEALDPALKRQYAIMERAGLLPEPPGEIEEADLEIQYVSVLTSAQTAVATIPTERFLGLVGNLAGVNPGVLRIPNWDLIVRNYGRDLGVRAEEINSIEVIEQQEEAEAQEEAMAKAGATAQVATEAAKTLSETEVGGGANALQRLINPYDRSGPAA